MKTDDEWIAVWNNKWKENFRENSKESWDFRNEFQINFLEDLLMNAKAQYYNTDKTIMTDKMYDRFEGFLRTLKPDSQLLIKIGGEEDM